MTSEPYKLAVLLQDLEFGGTQRYAVNLVKHLNRDLFDPELWVLRGGEDMIPFLRGVDVKIVWMSKSTWVGPRALFQLARNLVRNRPDILYTLTVVPNIWGRVFGSLRRVPVIVSGYRSLYPKQHERWLWRLSNRIICNAEVLRETMVRRSGVSRDRVRVIPNAVDTDIFRPAPDEKAPEPTVVYVGRLVQEKDPMNLVEGFRRTAEQLPEARFRLIGNGSMKPQVEEFVKAHRLESAISIIPGTKDIHAHFHQAWVFALASKQEASANVVIEAMACGLPVVLTRVGGLPELVNHGENGLLVDPHDPTQLAEALTTLLTDDAKRRAMGIKARERVMAHHSLQAMARKTEEVFLEALQEVSAARNRSMNRPPRGGDAHGGT